MRHGTASRRHRNRGNGGRRGGGGGGGQNRMQVFDSNGPEVRIRGTAFQVAEKYMVLAKDAASAGDRILAESYLQHAEHYQRIISSFGDDVQARAPYVPQAAGAPSGNAAEDGDLSLPASILGNSSKAESQVRSEERTSELSTT